MSRLQINIRFENDEDMYMYTHKQGNTTEYIKGLVNKDRLDRLDSSYIKKRREELREENKKLDELEKVSREDTDQVKEILNLVHTQYKIRMEGQSPDLQGFKLWCRSNILPKLKKARCNRYDVDSLLEMCAKGEIDV